MFEKDVNQTENRLNPEDAQILMEAITTKPRDWTRKHIKVLPKKYLLDNISTYTLTIIWPDLPEVLKQDEDIKNKLPCLEHYNRDEDVIHIDGPPPSKNHCWGCKVARK